MRAPLLALALLLSAPASAGVLVEGTLEGEPVRVELGPKPELAKVTLSGSSRLVDLARPLPVPDGGFRLRRWSHGPLVAGYGSDYHVLTLDETICGEVLAAAWMAPFLERAVKALAIVQQDEPTLQPTPREGCGAMPFGLYATNGFPLMAGWKDAAVFEATLLRFDHPPPPELVPPPPPENAAGVPPAEPAPSP
jgi:hypothetical protein